MTISLEEHRKKKREMKENKKEMKKKGDEKNGGNIGIQELLYRQLHLSRQDPIAFMPVSVDTSDSIRDDFSRFLFLYSHLEEYVLDNELPSAPVKVKTVNTYPHEVCHMSTYLGTYT